MYLLCSQVGTNKLFFYPVHAEPQYFRFEGVWLTETGMAVLRNLSLSPLHKRRPRKTTPMTPMMPRPGVLNGEGGLDCIGSLGADEKKDGDVEADEILKAEGSCLSY